MITVVNEPQSEYKVANWQTESNDISFDDFIRGIENGIVLLCPPSRSIYAIYSEKPKRKLSALRGKLTIQTKIEIDEQISNLRSEWDRSI